MERPATPSLGARLCGFSVAVVLLLLVFAPIAPLVHFQSTAHVYCPQHEQIEHRTLAEARADWMAHTAAPGKDSAGLDRVDHGVHKACGCCHGLTRPNLGLAQVEGPQVPAATRDSDLAPGRDRPFESLPRLTLAPKTSPPVS